jgi:hypothetical protein
MVFYDIKIIMGSLNNAIQFSYVCTYMLGFTNG